ncbi:MAG: division/cell wall cluster transcriptional repressor MraZ [Candidatus Eiseniibacteriota bacterium]
MSEGPQASDCPIYHGQDVHAIDAKGRVNIPARHRRIASKKGSLEFWFTPGFDGCVFLWDAPGFTEYAARISSLPSNIQDTRRLRRRIFTRTTRVEPDHQGRVVIPEALRRQANLDSQVLILGVHDHLELWNPAIYEAYDSESGETDGEIAEKLVF